MAFKPNYNQLRNERNRAKEARKTEKKNLLAEETAKRKALSTADEGDAPLEAELELRQG
ncbi:MAG: hypothetical protein HY055_06935 [Magnetospirillum sp.]|nr:hypothetical protein [Magnetospirillum sp.]